MSSKVILFITREIVPFYYGGIGTLFRSAARLLSEAGHKVCFLTPNREDFDYQVFKKYYRGSRCYLAEVPKEDAFVDYSPSGGVVSTFKLSYAFAIAEAFQAHLEEIQPDIVISADFGAESYVLLIQHALGSFPDTRFILHLSGALHEVLQVYQGHTGIDMADELSEPQNRLICSMEDTCMLLADEVIAPTRQAWNEVAQRLRLDGKKAYFIPNLLDRSVEGASVNRVKRISGEKYILFIGRLDRHKGADRVLRLFIDYQSRYQTDSELIMLGRDCFSKEYGKTFLEEWREKIPSELKDKIVFKGQVAPEVVAGYLENATACVFPSRWEVFGIVCLEAMSYGVPSIVAGGTGLAEVLGDELDELVFDFENDSDRLLEKLHELLSTTDTRNELPQKVKIRAQQVIEEAETGYKNIVEYNSSPAGYSEPSNQVVEKMLYALRATGEVSYYLGHDFKTLAQHCQMTAAELKEVIQKQHSVKAGLWTKLRNIIK